LQEAIIENSIADIKTGKGSNVNTEVVHQEIAEGSAPPTLSRANPADDNTMVHLSKPVFYGFMTLLIIFMALAGYSLFSKSSPPVNPITKVVVDTPKTIDTAQLAAEYYARKHREKQKLVDSATLNAIKDGMKPQTYDNPDSTSADTANKSNN